MPNYHIRKRDWGPWVIYCDKCIRKTIVPLPVGYTKTLEAAFIRMDTHHIKFHLKDQQKEEIRNEISGILRLISPDPWANRHGQSGI